MTLPTRTTLSKNCAFCKCVELESVEVSDYIVETFQNAETVDGYTVCSK